MRASSDFIVNKQRLDRTEFVTGSVGEATELGPNQALLSVDKFGFSANNITYAVVGEQMSYWSCFPCRDGWGRVPVWGYATVVRSEVDTLEPGTRIFGFLPMSTHLVVEPTAVSTSGFVDGATHRQGLSPAYNHYRRIAHPPDADADAAEMLLKPMFSTGFLIDDLLAAEGFFGAQSVIISSASSKTAVSLAAVLSGREGDRPSVVGLTSSRNRDFVGNLEYYNHVATYDDIDSLPVGPAVFVDIAGNRTHRRAVHRHFADSLRYSCRVGATHWHDAGDDDSLPGPAPVLFFAPGRGAQRIADWGMDRLQSAIEDQWRPFVADAASWLTFEDARGPEAVAQVYGDSLAGRTAPNIGYVLSL